MYVCISCLYLFLTSAKGIYANRRQRRRRRRWRWWSHINWVWISPPRNRRRHAPGEEWGGGWWDVAMFALRPPEQAWQQFAMSGMCRWWWTANILLFKYTYIHTYIYIHVHVCVYACCFILFSPATCGSLALLFLYQRLTNYRFSETNIMFR